MNIEIVGSSKNEGYIISIQEEIKRVLSTKKGDIPMNPLYGSNLYKYRDRTLDDKVRVAIINETYEAIEYAVKRVKPIKVEIIGKDGSWNLKIWVETKNDNA